MPHLHVVPGDRQPAGSAATRRVSERFELVSRAGKTLGLIELVQPDWPVGAIVERDGAKLHVVAVAPVRNLGEVRVLVVEPA